MTVTASCHCGTSSLVATRAPTEVTRCNCSICRRYGVLWAYYAVDDVDCSALGPTATYAWDDRSITFHRCIDCGCVTHWQSVDPAGRRMGVNARLFPLDVLAAARIRYLDGANTEAYVDE